ncbi:MAG: TolC family protein, partial [Gemmatimonadetes bacterium]|nr:TolC family protein [Gemmatimonadota bacterium]
MRGARPPAGRGALEVAEQLDLSPAARVASAETMRRFGELGPLALEQALLSLRTAVGDGDMPAVTPVAGALPVFDPATLDADALVERAAGRSPPVRAADAALGAAGVALDASRESWWPQLQASFDVGRQVQTRETEALFDFGGFGDQLYSQFRVSLSVPFFGDPFGNRVSAARAEVALDDRREALREARMQAEQSVRSSLVALRNQWETLRIAQRALDIAGRALEMAREEYRTGTRTFEALQTSIDLEGQAVRQVITARYGFLDALVTLEDLEGAVEVMFFPQSYVNAAVHLVEDAVVLVRGRVDRREDVPKIIANEITVPDLSVGPRGPVVVCLPT